VNDYEILLMLDPDLPEERQEEIVKRTRDLVEKSGGTWDGQDAWGRRKLAYEINKKPTASTTCSRSAPTATPSTRSRASSRSTTT
jgi:ribosomal protein S6